MTDQAKARRDKLFKLTAKTVNAAPIEELPHVWGVIMETAHPETVITVYVSPGNANIYFGAGGKNTGAGKKENVKKAEGKLLLTGENVRNQFKPAKDFPLPKIGQARFYLFTYSGILTAEANEKKLQERKHPLWPLYVAVDDVITEIRIVTKGR